LFERVSMVSPLPASRPAEGWGVGVRHALFPRSLAFGAQLHPSSDAGCQFPDAAPVCMDECRPFRPRSGAGPRCFHRRPSGEASQPGIRTPAGALPPDPARILLRSLASGPSAQGRHRTFRSRSLALRYGSCLLPLLLPFLSQADDSVFGASRGSELIAPPRSSPAFRRLPFGSLTPR
jgi:hypothetical protein